jgi:hypothetical protein
MYPVLVWSVFLSVVFCVVFCRSLFVLLSLFFWPLYCLFYRCTASNYPFGIFWPLHCLFYRCTASDYPFGIFWPLHCLFYRCTASNYPFGIFWPLYCLFYRCTASDYLPLVSSNFSCTFKEIVKQVFSDNWWFCHSTSTSSAIIYASAPHDINLVSRASMYVDGDIWWAVKS